MLIEPTMEKLKSMQLRGMAAGLERQGQDPDTQALSFEERLGLLVDEEWTQRRNRALARLLREAKLKLPACPEDLDYSPARGLDRALMRSLSGCDFVREHQNVLVMGATGTGKTYVACALGNASCRHALRARYFRLSALLTELAISKGDGTYPGFMARLAKTELLILDDYGLTPLSALEARDLLEVIDERVSQDRRWCAPDCRSSTGTGPSAIPPSLTPSSIAWSMERTSSPSRENPCGRRKGASPATRPA